VWSDYLCPWAYLGTDRTALLVELGLTVTVLPFELHPELPAEGRAVKPGGRLAAVFDYIASECASAGLAFRAPTHIPNSRAALQAAELVREHEPESFDRLHAALFAAVFVDARDIGDVAVLKSIVDECGANGTDVADAIHRDIAWPAVRASTDAAIAQGVTGTPAYLLDNRLLVPGVQPREALAQWVSRLRDRPAAG